MSELNPEIWNNEKLGLAAQNRNLSVEEEQARENRSAEIEGREPRKVVHEGGYPGWNPEADGYRPSYAKEVHFEDERPNDIPRGEITDELATQGIENDQNEGSDTSPVESEPEPEAEPVITEEENQTWS